MAVLRLDDDQTVNAMLLHAAAEAKITVWIALMVLRATGLRLAGMNLASGAVSRPLHTGRRQSRGRHLPFGGP